jgi:hypothetical protein
MARRGAGSARSELSLTPPALDRVLEWPSRAEAALLRSGVRLPVGLSLLAVLRARNEVRVAAPVSALTRPAIAA